MIMNGLAPSIRSTSLSITHQFYITPETKFLYGASKKDENFMGNILRPFPSEVWILLLVTMCSVTLFLLAARSVYLKMPEPANFLRSKNVSRSVVVFKAFGTMTEPEGMKIFKGWVIGKIYIE